MTPLLALSIACAAFVAGFTFGLMFVAVVRARYELHDYDFGAPEGDQTTRPDQSPRSPSAR